MDIEILSSVPPHAGGSRGGETFAKRPNILEGTAYRDTWGKEADSFIAMIYEGRRMRRKHPRRTRQLRGWSGQGHTRICCLG